MHATLFRFFSNLLLKIPLNTLKFVVSCLFPRWRSRRFLSDCGPIYRQNDEPGGPNMDLPPEKKLEAEKRGMAMNDYNGEMRKGGRGPSGGVLYRPGSKEPAPADAASYYDKVRPHARRRVRTWFPLVTLLFFLPGRFCLRL